MDSEFLAFVVIVLLVIIVVATLIQWPGNSTSVTFSLIFCLVVAVVGGFIFGTLAQWGRQPSDATYLFWFIAVFGLTFIPAYVIRHFIFPAFLQAGLIKWPVMLGVCVGVFIAYRYAAFYRQYEWQLLALDHGDVQVLSGPYFSDLVHESPYGGASYRQIFARRFDLYSPMRLRPHKYPEAGEDNIFTLTGLPSSLYAVFHVPASGKLYRVELKLPKREIERLSAWRWLYPLYNHQKYYFLELLLSDTGMVAIYVANSEESKLVAFVQAKEIEVGLLSPAETVQFNNKGHEPNEKELMSTPQTLFANQYSVGHKITGNSENLVELKAIGYNGERYALAKENWGGQSLPGLHAPLACIRYLTYNAEGALLEWVYQYSAVDLKSSLEMDGFGTEKPVSLLYSYSLRFGENKKLVATNNEYINGEMNEFKATVTISRVGSDELQ